MYRIFIVILGLVTVMPSDTQASPPALGEKAHWRLEDLGGVQLNHPLFGNELNMGYLWPLFPDAQGPLKQKTHIKVGFLNTLSPVVQKLGAYFEIHPLRIIKWRISVEGVGIIPLTGSMDSTDDPIIDFNATARSAEERAGAIYASYGLQATNTLIFQIGYKNVAARNTTSWRYYWMQLREDDAYFYLAQIDLMGENGAFVQQNHSELVWLGKGLMLGLRWSHVNVLYNIPAARPEGYGNSQSLGPVIAIDLPKKWAGKNQMQFVIQSQWWLHHPNKMGEDAPQWFPALAFALMTNRDYD
jgi:hypothetical protein